MPLPIDDVVEILRAHLQGEALQAAVKEAIQAEKELKAERAATAAPKAKTRLAVLVRGGAEVQRALDGGCYIVSVPDDETTNTYAGQALVERIRKAAVAHNEAPKGRRSKSKRRIQTLNDAMTLLKAKTLKNSGSNISIKQKGQPCEAVVVLTEDILAPVTL